MTRKTFYAKLRSVKSKFVWKNVNGGIRGYSRRKEAKDVEFCPLTAVNYALTGDIYDVGDFTFAANDLGVSRDDAGHIVTIADDSVDYLNGSLITARQHLLKTVGLKPEKRDKSI